MPQNTPRPPRRVLDVAALKALGHPLRVRILDRLGLAGPQTASTLAAALGESSGATSYHLRILARAHLIEDVPDRGDGRERWWKQAEGGLQIGDADVTRTPSGQAATQLAMAEMFRLRNEQALAYLNRVTRADRPDEDASFQLGTARLTRADFEEYVTEISAVMERFADRSKAAEAAGDGSARPYYVRFELYPGDEVAVTSEEKGV